MNIAAPQHKIYSAPLAEYNTVHQYITTAEVVLGIAVGKHIAAAKLVVSIAVPQHIRAARAVVNISVPQHITPPTVIVNITRRIFFLFLSFLDSTNYLLHRNQNYSTKLPGKLESPVQSVISTSRRL